MIRYT